MMDWGSPVFVLSIIALSYGCWLVNNWIRARNGYALENEWGGTTEKSDNAEAQKLRAENRELLDKLDKMQDRMIVLEKIVTDRGYTLSEEIEALRDTRKVEEQGSGVPLNVESRETA